MYRPTLREQRHLLAVGEARSPCRCLPCVISRSLRLDRVDVVDRRAGVERRRTSCGVDAPAPRARSRRSPSSRCSTRCRPGAASCRTARRTTRTTSTMIRPMRLTPRCLAQLSVARRALLFSLQRNDAEAPELVQVQPDEERLADDVLVGHEAPVAAVARVVPVVAHHEVVARRNRAREAARIVVAISGERERARRRHRRPARRPRSGSGARRRSASRRSAWRTACAPSTGSRRPACTGTGLPLIVRRLLRYSMRSPGTPTTRLM